MPAFDQGVIDAVQNQRDVELTTWGRKSGNARRIIIWIVSDGERVYVRAGGGLRQDWPRNLLAHGRGILHLAGRDLPVRPRHLTDRDEARKVGALFRQKYNSTAASSSGDEPPTPGESASFELLPDGE